MNINKGRLYYVSCACMGAIDLLANLHSLSCSGLARKSGLDPTVFNKSKRVTNNGKPHYPSMHSVAKVLSATGTTPIQFAQLIQAQIENDKIKSKAGAK